MITEVFIAVDRDEVYRATLPTGEYVIGRDPDAQIRIEHPTISRRHARLIVDEDQLVLTDLDSGNGTMIEEIPLVGPRHLYEGQTARLGDVLLRARQNVALEVLPPSIGSYRKGDVVAAGGMGAIHEARQSAMGRKVAMKVMLREESKSGLRRFINEARITGMLEHPNIVPVHELGVDGDGRAFYTMKFVHGTTLAEVLAGLRTGHPEAVKKYPLPFLLTIFQKVCDGIAFAHSRGVHHRDLKPENVMIGDFGEVLVMDWGLSKETGFASEAEDVLPGAQSGDGTGLRTMEGSVLGTPAYMSPEQARGEINAVDERSDIYCLGAILHEILYLQPPVSGSNAHEIVDKVGRGEMDVVRDIERPHWPGGRIPPSLEAVRRKAMAHDPERRYQRVTGLQADIAAYQTGFATSAEEAGVATQALLFVRRNRGVSVSVLTGLILLAVVSMTFIWNLQHQLTEKEVLLGKLNAANTEKDDLLKEKDNLLVENEQARLLAEENAQVARENAQRAEAALEEAKRESERADSSETLAGNENEANAKKSFDLAMEAMREGKLERAMREIESAIERSPANPEYLMLRADLLQSSGQLGAAVEAYREAIDLGAGGSAVENLGLSEKYASQRDPEGGISDEAYEELSKALVNQKRNRELRFLDAARNAAEGGLRNNPAAQAGASEVPSELTSLDGWSGERYELLADGTVRLNLSGLEIRSLESLRTLNLRSLDLRGTEATNLSPLVGMRLEELYVAPGTSNLGPLQAQAQNLRVLDLRGSQVADLGPLAQASGLEKLWIDNTPVQNLEPLSGKPLKLLSVDLPGLKNFEVIGSLTKLEELALPKHAAGVPVAGLEALKKVRHSRFQIAGEMDGQKFKELSAKSDEAWQRWRGELAKLAPPVLEADRVTVVEEDWRISPAFPQAFDLDLRGLEISELRPLRDVPLNRLYVDTKTKPVSLKPLEKHKTLQHLVLTGANVPTLQGVLDRQALKSVVLSKDTSDVRRLYNSPTITLAGYESDASTRLPTTTTKQLFAERDPRTALPAHPRPGSQTESKFLFDDPGMMAKREIEKWKLLPAPKDDANGLAWRPDPPLEGGKGGGYLQFLERAEDSQTSYFQLPNEFRNKKKDLYGASLGFELRAEGDGDRKAGDEGDVIVGSGAQSLHYTFSGREPAEDWRKFQVIFQEGEGWRVGSPRGNPATAEEMKAGLFTVSDFLIRAEFHNGGSYERTGLDNVALWDVVETRARVTEAKQAEQEKSKWTVVESGGVGDWMGKMGLMRAFDTNDNRFRVSDYKGRYGPLLVSAVSADVPARITLKPEVPLDSGTRVRFAARGAPTGSGVTVKVLQNGSTIQELLVGDRWSECSALLPQGIAAKGETLCVLEVWPNGEIDPYCFISGLELVPPSGRN